MIWSIDNRFDKVLFWWYRCCRFWSWCHAFLCVYDEWLCDMRKSSNVVGLWWCIKACVVVVVVCSVIMAGVVASRNNSCLLPSYLLAACDDEGSAKTASTWHLRTVFSSVEAKIRGFCGIVKMTISSNFLHIANISGGGVKTGERDDIQWWNLHCWWSIHTAVGIILRVQEDWHNIKIAANPAN